MIHQWLKILVLVVKFFHHCGRTDVQHACRIAHTAGIEGHSDGIVKLTQKIARLCSRERTIEGFGLSRAPVFSLFPLPQLSSRGRRLRAIFHELDDAFLPPRQDVSAMCKTRNQ